MALVFHNGAPFLERFPFLEAGPKGKAYAKFCSMDEADRHSPELAALVVLFVAGKGEA